jgi:hypothetical protein
MYTQRRVVTVELHVDTVEFETRKNMDYYNGGESEKTVAKAFDRVGSSDETSLKRAASYADNHSSNNVEIAEIHFDGSYEETVAKTVAQLEYSDETSLKRVMSREHHSDSISEYTDHRNDFSENEYSLNETGVKVVADNVGDTRLNEVSQGDIVNSATVHNEAQSPCVRPLPPRKLYHAFLSYHVMSDGPWVQRVRNKLENTYGYKCCDHERDFIPGWKILENITHCVMSSAKTVVIMSPDAVKSGWCSYEAELTLHMSNDMRRKILIPVMLEDCVIPSHLKPLTYIDARGDEEVWWPKLIAALDMPGIIY